MKTLLLIFLATAISVTFANSTTTCQIYKLKGKAISNYGRDDGCGGIFSNHGLKEFEIIDFSDSTYTEPIVAVVFGCPGSWLDSTYQPGEVYELLVTDSLFRIELIHPYETYFKKYKNKQIYRIKYPQDTVTNFNPEMLRIDDDSLPGMHYLKRD